MVELLDVKMVLSKSDQIVAISFALCVKRNVISNISQLFLICVKAKVTKLSVRVFEMLIAFSPMLYFYALPVKLY